MIHSEIRNLAVITSKLNFLNNVRNYSLLIYCVECEMLNQKIKTEKVLNINVINT